MPVPLCEPPALAGAPHALRVILDQGRLARTRGMAISRLHAAPLHERIGRLVAQRPVQHEEHDGTHRFKVERATLELRFPERTVVQAVGTGHLTANLINPVLDVLEKSLTGRPPVDLFCDAAEIEGYDPRVRRELQRWVRDNKDRLITVNVLAVTNMVRMGITVSNLRLAGFIWSWSNAKEFSSEIHYRIEECKRGLPRAKRRPPQDRDDGVPA